LILHREFLYPWWRGMEINSQHVIWEWHEPFVYNRYSSQRHFCNTQRKVTLRTLQLYIYVRVHIFEFMPAIRTASTSRLEKCCFI
jgi:hypothetical protein